MPVWLLLAVTALAVVAFVVRAGRPSLIMVRVESTQVVVRMDPADTVYALKRGLSIPLSSITRVSVQRRDDVPHTGLRFPGAFFPGVIRAGSFGVGASRDFWFVRRAKEVLVMELDPPRPYRRVVLELVDPRATADEIQRHLVPRT